jgi:hypothetical protein
MADVAPARVRSWRMELLHAGLSAVTVAKAYRLLNAVLSTAVDDELPDLRAHLDEWSQDGADGRVFVGPKGATPKRERQDRLASP